MAEPGGVPESRAMLPAQVRGGDRAVESSGDSIRNSPDGLSRELACCRDRYWKGIFYEEHAGARLDCIPARPARRGLRRELLYLPRAAADVIFMDGTFNLSNYSITTYSNLLSPDTVTLSQNTSGGNPGDFLAQNFSISSTVSGTRIISALINNGWTYNPATQGAISSINFSIYKLTTVTLTFENGTLAAFQDGKYYIFIVPGPVDVGGWETIAHNGITSSPSWAIADLVSAGISSGAPNFTASGDPLSFGFLTGATGPLGGVSTLGTDNVVIDIKPAISTVPELSTLIALGTAILLLGFSTLLAQRFLR